MIKDQLTSIENDIKNNRSLKLGIQKTKEKIYSEIEKIKFNELRIKKEKELRKMPSQAVGSVALYNKLNENYSYYEENEFKNILRFLTHIEDKEKQYRKLYVDTTSNYIDNPETVPINELKQTKKELDYSYKLLIILANEIKGDKVSYGKVYNKIEDSGLFMSVPEKKSQDYLNQISNKLGLIMNGLKVIFNQLKQNNEILKSIDNTTSETSFMMGDVSNSLWDLSFEVSNLK